MKKLLIHSPKGGVGKTTIATNIALLLARKGYKVWACDLAQGALMTEFLLESSEFNCNDNKITTEELGTIPNKMEGSGKYDYLVADTDDYYNVMADIANKDKSGDWRIIIPIVNEYIGLKRIPDEIQQIMIANMVKGRKPRLAIFINKYEKKKDYKTILEALKLKNVEDLLSSNYIGYCKTNAPYFVDNETFKNQLEAVLDEMGCD